MRNVFAYGAEGNPLSGVQLDDQKGRPLEVSQDPYLGSYRSAGARVHTYPWSNGDQLLYNVFPLPVRAQRGDQPVRDAWVTTRPPVLPTPPAAEPQVTPTPSPSASPTGQASPSDSEKPRSR